jgi:hypothetical protein
MPLQIRRGLQAERTAMTVPLAEGELLYVTDDQRLYIGNGNVLGGLLITGYSNEDAQEAVAQALLGANPVTSPDNSRHSGIIFVYNDDDNRLDATVDFSGLDVLQATAFQGSLFADNGTLLIDAVLASINLDGTVKGNIIPDVTETYDIGSSEARFRDLYLSGSSLYLGDAQITATGSAVNLPAGSTIDGIVISTAALTGEGVVAGSNYNINIVGDDSTLLVDTASSRIVGSIDTLTGNITNLTSVNFIVENIGTTNPEGVVISASGNDNLVVLQDSVLVQNVPLIVNDGVFGNTTGYHTGDVTGSVFADDSTLLVDGTSGRIVGPVDTASITFPDATVQTTAYTGYHTGDVTGSVFADDSTLLVDAINGSFSYFPATPGDWNGTAPTTVGEAIDRLATLVKTLNSGTGA